MHRALHTIVPASSASLDNPSLQVLFSADGQIGECAAMNVFFLIEPEGGEGPAPRLVTPALDDGTILAGVTRLSVLELVRSRRWTLPPRHALADGGGESGREGGGEGADSSDSAVAVAVEERAIGVSELREIARSGRLLECFGTGTAVVCQPVEAVVFPGETAATAGSGGGGERWHCRHAYDGSSLAEQLLSTIQDIQYGRRDHPWSVPVCRLGSE
jgi:branched-chain amino acid aminotransferase